MVEDEMKGFSFPRTPLNENPMCWIFVLAVLPLLSPGTAGAQDTFSIVAVDSVTGEVGSAGASCVAGSIILSDVHPGVGAIHTQSFWNAGNQNYARTLMNDGIPPEQIIDSLVAHDGQGDPSIRQYGVIDLAGGGRSAGFTGVNCYDYKNHVLGPDFAIAGNILMGQEILDSMETRFKSTPGILADRLMAALQGAKVPGADTRCLASGRSSISAFIRVARPEDTTGVLFLSLNVNNAPDGVDPIDSLQVLFDEWRGGISSVGPDLQQPAGFILGRNYPNPFNPSSTIEFRIVRQADVSLIVYDLLGREVAVLVDETLAPGTYTRQWDGAGSASGVYLYQLRVQGFVDTGKMTLIR